MTHALFVCFSFPSSAYCKIKKQCSTVKHVPFLSDNLFFYQVCTSYTAKTSSGSDSVDLAVSLYSIYPS